MNGLILSITDEGNVPFIEEIRSGLDGGCSCLKKNNKGDIVFLKLGDCLKRIEGKYPESVQDFIKKNANKIIAIATLSTNPEFGDLDWGRGYAADFNKVCVLQNPVSIKGYTNIKQNKFGGHTFLTEKQCKELLVFVSQTNRLSRPYGPYKSANDELMDDRKYVQDVINTPSDAFRKKDKKERKTRSIKSFSRDRYVAVEAMKRARYVCEINPAHHTFKKKNEPSLNYLEPHHLIPTHYQDQFEENLDVVENIVCLCSNCHNEIHYGVNSLFLVEKLYEERKEQLKKAGLKVTLKELKDMYS